MAQTGTTIYAPDSVGSLILVDVDGNQIPMTDDRRNFWSPRFSPNGRLVAVSIVTGTGYDIWIYDLSRVARAT